jgi:hypothetical protein
MLPCLVIPPLALLFPAPTAKAADTGISAQVCAANAGKVRQEGARTPAG